MVTSVSGVRAEGPDQVNLVDAVRVVLWKSLLELVLPLVTQTPNDRGLRFLAWRSPQMSDPFPPLSSVVAPTVPTPFLGIHL